MKIRKLKVRVKKKCHCWEKGHWFIEGYDTCNGTRERDPCRCGGDRNKCDFHKGEIHNESKEA